MENNMLKPVVKAEKLNAGNCKRSPPGCPFPTRQSSLIYSNLRNLLTYIIEDQNLAKNV